MYLNYSASKTSMEPSKKDVGKLEGVGSKFVEICRLLEINICRHGGGECLGKNCQGLLWTFPILLDNVLRHSNICTHCSIPNQSIYLYW